MKRWAALSFAVLMACQSGGTGTDAPDGLPKLNPAERAACLADGDRVGEAGLARAEFCIRRAPDAGKSCARSTDCAGVCLADTRACSAELTQYGCYSFLDETGAQLEICVD